MTELTWDGKYSKDGKKNAPVRISLPFQTIETVNESAQDRQHTLDIFRQGKQPEWRNRLIWGDKKYVLPSLLPEFAGKVNLIYIDPPFDTGADFSYKATIPEAPESSENGKASFTKLPSIIEQKAYRDTWGRGLESYLQWFYETVVLLRELLADDGSIYVHLDWHVGHYAKAVLDEVFGYENFLNEIIWQLSTTVGSSKAIAKRFPTLHDIILLYTKSSEFNFNKIYLPPSEKYKARFRDKDDKGYYYWNTLATYSQETYTRLEKEGKLRWTSGAKYPQYKTYLHELKGNVISSVWADINMLNPMANERIGYETQKPKAMIERIIKTSSNESDLVLDCFCGSGTTAAVAEKFNRRWITCDLGRFAIHTTRKRLLGISGVKPFMVQNLGKYERQQWMVSEFQDTKERVCIEKRYRDFILQLYHAEPITGYSWLHGAKAGRIVHVGTVDAPITFADVSSIVQEFWKSVGKSPDLQTNGIDILGWEFAFEINEIARQFADANKVDLKFKPIPREVLEKKAVEQGDIKFFELASLSVDMTINGKSVKIALSDFIVPPDDIPEDVRRCISHWSQWIDYWAIDWNYRNDTFHNEWQSYRTKKDMKIDLQTSHKYAEKGRYQVVIKVIDILGNDTTKLAEVEVE